MSLISVMKGINEYSLSGHIQEALDDCTNLNWLKFLRFCPHSIFLCWRSRSTAVKPLLIYPYTCLIPQMKGLNEPMQSGCIQEALDDCTSLYRPKFFLIFSPLVCLCGRRSRSTAKYWSNSVSYRSWIPQMKGLNEPYQSIQVLKALDNDTNFFLAKNTCTQLCCSPNGPQDLGRRTHCTLLWGLGQ